MAAALEINGLVKRFGGLTAVDGIGFSVARGESLGLIGPNGAGKTTIFSQIMGEVRQTSGTIKLNGEEISSLKPAARIQRGVARTYQVPRPFKDLTVLENIRVGAMPDSVRRMLFTQPDQARERELAMQVGLDESDFERTPDEISMGNLRKLEMARTIATGAEVVLLDEVFAGLTRAETDQISALIQQMRKAGMTLLVVSHDLPALKPLVDTVVAIDRGREIARGGFDAVIADKAVRESYLGAQEGRR